MRKAKWLFLFLSLNIAGFQNSSAQDIHTISGIGGSTPSIVNVVFDIHGNMYFAGSYHVYEMSASTGAISVYAGIGFGTDYAGDGGLATDAVFDYISYLAINSGGDLFICDGDVVRKITQSTGIVSRVAGDETYGGTFSGDGGAATLAGLNNPTGVAVDAAGNLYISDFDNNRIRKVDASGYISTIAGDGTGAFYGDGGPAVSSEISAPLGICVDEDSHYLYFADLGNVRIRQIDITSTSGNIQTVAGNGTSGFSPNGTLATSSDLYNPWDVSIDCQNNIYISDQVNLRIRMFPLGGNINTVAGTGTITAGFHGEGGPAVAADLVFPSFVDLDNIGNFYIGDNAVCRIVCDPSAPTLPTVTITADPINCTSSTVNIFHATVSGGTYCGTLNYYWDINGSHYFTSTPEYTDASSSLGNTVSCQVYYTTNQINDVCTSGAPSSVYSSASNTLTEVGTSPTPISVMGIDINTLCAPGNGGPSPVIFTTSASGGVGTYTYYWSHDGYSNATLSSYTVQNPNVISATGPSGASGGRSEFLFTVTDSRGCSDTYDANLKFMSSGWDLASKDNPFDLYLESVYGWVNAGVPDREYNIWSSSDIWNRYYEDGFTTNQPPEWWASCSGCTSGAANYLYMRVRNEGCATSPDLYTVCTPTGGGSPVDLPVGVTPYFTYGAAAGAELWTSDWYILAGPRIPLNSISAGASQVIDLKWYPPNPGPHGGEPKLCFLSRIEDGHNETDCIDNTTDGMTIQETYGVNTSCNVRNNNNIVTMNTGDMWIMDPPPVSTRWWPHGNIIYAGNPRNIGSAAVSLQFINSLSFDPATAGNSTLSSVAYFKVYLGDVFDAWVAAGSYGTYTTYDANEKSVTFDGSTTVTLDSIILDTFSYPITIVPYMLPGSVGSMLPSETINFRGFTDDTGLAIGNFAFNIRYDNRTSPKGTLAVTEISQGPNGHTGCEYIECIVSACDTVPSTYVDIRGWQINDNDGGWDIPGCTIGYGITRGNYRLAYDSIWQNVPVGSKIVIYNQDVNCYAMQDTFFIDTANLIYYVPVPATAPGAGYVLEMYTGVENASMCSYCSDTGTTVYTPACCWTSIIDLNNTMDAVSVLCPGCTTSNPGSPAFYQGIGYAPSSLSGFLAIPSSTNSPGGPYVVNLSGANRKYTFTGSTAADFSSAGMWTDSAANSAGTPPPTLGNVDSALQFAASTNTLGLPCCTGILGERHANPHHTATNTNINNNNTIPATAPTQIKVYPNPANMQVYFEYPLSANVSIQILDITGRLLDQQTLPNTSTATFDVSNYKPGLYLYHITADNLVQTGKITVE